jgi:hypothetical protein
MTTRHALLPLLLGSLLLTGCPVARPKSVDCDAVKNQIEQVDKALVRFVAVDPNRAQIELNTGWSLALSGAQKSFASTDTLVHDDVKQAANQYKKTLDALSAAVADQVAGKGSPEATIAARTAFLAARTQVDERCAK